MKIQTPKPAVPIVLLIVPVFTVHLMGLQWSANTQPVQEDPFPQPMRIEMSVEKAIRYHDPTLQSKQSTSQVTTFYQSEQAWYQEVREKTDDDNKIPVLIQQTWNGTFFSKFDAI